MNIASSAVTRVELALIGYTAIDEQVAAFVRRELSHIHVGGCAISATTLKTSRQTSSVTPIFVIAVFSVTRSLSETKLSRYTGCFRRNIKYFRRW
jgi:hypothetical protein